jgi:lipid-binding SYLF domain-containing protein
MYGSDATHQEILNGKVAAPEPAQKLLAELARYSVKSVSRR